MDERDHTLDAARAISMLYILGIWHLNDYSKFLDIGFAGQYIKNATLGLFMFISSFLLGKKYRIEGLKDIKEFLAKRFLRIFPLFVLSVYSYHFFGLCSTSELVKSVLGVSVFIPPMLPTVWFISMLILFYFVFLSLGGKRPIKQISLAGGLMIVLGILESYNLIDIDRRFWYYFPCFALGSILSKFEVRDLLNRQIIGVSLIIVSIIIAAVELDVITVQPYLRAVISICGVFLVLLFSHWIAKIRNSRRLLLFLAEASFVSYLFHRQAFHFFENAVFWPEDGFIRWCYLLFVCIPLILLFSYFLQRSFNKVMRSLIALTKSSNSADYY